MNNFFQRHLKIFLPGLFLLLLSSCELHSKGGKVEAQPDISQHAAIATDHKAVTDDVKAKPHSKPGAPVKLKDTQPLVISAPGEYEHSLYLVSPADSGRMVVEVVPDAGLDIVSPAREFEFDLYHGGEYALPLKLSALVKGRFYINLHISVTAHEQVSSRVIAAIVQVGEPPAKIQKAPSAKNALNPREEVISLPAQETVSPR